MITKTAGGTCGGPGPGVGPTPAPGTAPAPSPSSGSSAIRMLPLAVLLQSALAALAALF